MLVNNAAKNAFECTAYRDREMQTIYEEEEEKGNRSDVRPDRGKLIRSIGDGWNEYVTDYGRHYYRNEDSGETSWKPPRRNILPQIPVLGTKMGESAGKLDKYGRAVAAMDSDKPVGRILKTGTLNAAAIRKKGGKKKKWMRCYVVLTEYYIIFTVQPGILQKIFRKSKNPKTGRFYLPETFIRREKNDKKGVIRIGNLSREVLFTSADATETEMWYQILKLVTIQPCSRGNSLENLVIPKTRDKCFSLEPEKIGLPRSSSSGHLQIKRPIPTGWIDKYDPETGRFYYVNALTGRRWFSEMAVNGSNFFFEEGTGRASWLLPQADSKTTSLMRMTTV